MAVCVLFDFWTALYTKGRSIVGRVSVRPSVTRFAAKGSKLEPILLQNLKAYYLGLSENLHRSDRFSRP